MAQVTFFLCILFVQHENEGGHLTKCLRVLLIFPQSLNPSVKTHRELNSSLETSLLSSFFWMFLSSCGHFHLDIQETYQSSRVQNRPLVLNFPCPFPTSTPFSLLQLPKTNIRNYPWFLVFFPLSHVTSNPSASPPGSAPPTWLLLTTSTASFQSQPPSTPAQPTSPPS